MSSDVSFENYQVMLPIQIFSASVHQGQYPETDTLIRALGQFPLSNIQELDPQPLPMFLYGSFSWYQSPELDPLRNFIFYKIQK